MRVALIVLCSLTAAAQDGRRLVRASGEATVSARPDLGKVVLGVVTRAGTAQEAAQQNAAQVESMLGQLRLVLSPGSNIETISYSLTPEYQYPQGAPRVLIGYTASNTVEVTTPDLSALGRVIDVATQAGANNIGGLRFTVKDVEALKSQALTLAARQAKAHAEAIASGLGARVGSVVLAQEGASVRPVPVQDRTGAATPAQTPIETGWVEVYATVTIDAELIS